MKEDIFAVSGMMGRAFTRKVGNKTVSRNLFSGKSKRFGNFKRKTYDWQGLFLFPVTSGLSLEEKEEKEKEHQERLMELMDMYQRYHDLIREEEYALRGSKMKCSYGTKIALLDTREDHGVYKGSLPVMTCKDCQKWNLHDFGSCMCPESKYMGRVDMTVPVHDGRTAQKAPWNQYPHICVPLINEKQGWHQTIGEVWIKNEEGEAERVLVLRAFLICRYGGIIHLEEVADSKTLEAWAEKAYQTLNKWYLEGYASVTQDQLDVAMEDMAMYGAENNIGCLGTITDLPQNEMTDRIKGCIENGRADKYDTMILAWTNYWNMTMDKRQYTNAAPVRADVIKAMTVVESNLGDDNTVKKIVHNPERDIMQALDPRNPVFWIVIGEASKGTITVEIAGSDVLELGIDEKEKVCNGIGTKPPGPGEASFFEGGMSEAVKELLSPDLTRYYSEKVTPELSVAVGVGYYCLKLNGATNNGAPISEEGAVKNYNGGGDPKYAAKVDMVLENMGVDKLGTKK